MTEVRRCGRPEELGTALHAARAAGQAWVWSLARGAVPEPNALDELLSATTGAPTPVIVAGLVLDPSGDVLLDALPRAPEDRPRDVVDQAALGRLPLRSAGLAHTLVATRVLDRHGVPDLRSFGAFAAAEWSARVLRDEPGCFVPSSVVRLGADSEPPALADAVRAALRLHRRGSWTTGEAVRALRAARPRRRVG